ncbi:class I SAM-dependent methyltransferase [Corynebacterium tapiri]|uniref:class I SAM-dependent methyltransferase n=1 Tax=Corynebacterium tapiri TaxID=1448266 RepID=UPI001FE645B1|nr:class I SAM-dependent methyltransferase [Corynebacterium tapiri]
MSGHNHLPEDFEAVYASGVQWSGNPNQALIREAQDFIPGSAIDVGCGEGADSVWLAERGWKVLAIDPAPTAIRRARELAVQRGVDKRIEFCEATIQGVGEQTFDLVSCFYLPMKAEELATLESLVAPGGNLLFVHHEHVHGDIMSPRAVADALTTLKVIELKSTEREVAGGAGAHHTVDEVLIARKA